MTVLKRKAWAYANSMVAVGLALNTVADLLGADGLEHHLSREQENGLVHTVLALGELVLNGAGELAELSDPDSPQCAPRNDTLPNRGADEETQV